MSHKESKGGQLVLSKQQLESLHLKSWCSHCIHIHFGKTQPEVTLGNVFIRNENIKMLNDWVANSGMRGVIAALDSFY